MAKGKNKKNFFVIIFGSAGAVVVTAFLLSAFAVVLAGNGQSRLNNSSAEPASKFSVYVISGKIIDIQGKTITIEAPVFDYAGKRWDKDKKETRKLTVDSENKLFKSGHEWKEEKKELETVLYRIKLADLKIGDRLIASYTGNLLEIKDFTPTMITILPD